MNEISKEFIPKIRDHDRKSLLSMKVTRKWEEEDGRSGRGCRDIVMKKRFAVKGRVGEAWIAFSKLAHKEVKMTNIKKKSRANFLADLMLNVFFSLERKKENVKTLCFLTHSQ